MLSRIGTEQLKTIQMPQFKFTKGDEFTIVDTAHGSFICTGDAVAPISRGGKEYSPQPTIEPLMADGSILVRLDVNDSCFDGDGKELFKINGPRPTAVRKR